MLHACPRSLSSRGLESRVNPNCRGDVLAVLSVADFSFFDLSHWMIHIVIVESFGFFLGGGLIVVLTFMIVVFLEVWVNLNLLCWRREG